MLKEILLYAKGLSSLSGWKLDAEAARNTYLKNASRNTKGSRSKKPNRMHVSRKTKRRHKRR